MRTAAFNSLYRFLRRVPRLESRLAFISQLEEGAKLLDVGCGSGEVLRRFLQVRPDLEISGIDQNDFQDILPPEIDFHQLDAGAAPWPWPDQYFDGISLIQLLEHLKKPNLVIQEAFRVLKPEGIFYLETPDVKSLKIPSFNAWLPDHGAGPLNFHDDPTHLKLFAQNDLISLLREIHPATIQFNFYRNWIYTVFSPGLILAGLLARKRRWVVVGLHNLVGWSLSCSGKKGPVPAEPVANHHRARWVKKINKLGKFLWKISGLKKSQPLKVTPPSKILVIRLDHLGDVLLSTPVYEALKTKFPHAKITALVGPWSQDLLRDNPYVDEVITLSCPWWAGKRGQSKRLSFPLNYLRVLRQLRQKRFDLGIDLRGDIRHILLFLFAGRCRQRLSYDRSGGEYLLTCCIRAPGFFSLSEGQKNSLLLKQGLNIPITNLIPNLWWGEDDQKAVDTLLNKVNINQGDFIVILSPSARNLIRTWPPERFAAIADWLTQAHQAKIILIGGRESTAILNETEAKMQSSALNLAGKTSLLEAAALCEKGSLFIGVEGGLMHLAAATSIPILALYGPMLPALTSHQRDNFHYLCHSFPCSPCLQNECPYSITPHGDCMEKISFQEVKKALEKILPKIRTESQL